MFRWFCLYHKFYCSYIVEWSPIKGLDTSPSKVDLIDDANPFGRAPKEDITF